MPSEMFGSPIGERAAADELNTDANTFLMLGQLAGLPAKQRLTEAQAGAAELELSNERSMARLMQQAAANDGHGVGKGGSIGDTFEDLGRLAMKAGLTTKATEFSKTGAYLRAQESLQQSRVAAQRVNELKAAGTRMDLFGRLLTDVTDEDSWNRANLMYQLESGAPSMWAGLPYSPDLVQRLRTGAMSVKDQIAEQLRGEENASKERSRRALAAHRLQIEGIQKDRNRIMEEREKRISKGGSGKAVTGPAKAEVDQAVRLVKGDFKDLPDSDYLNAAYEVAAEAKSLRRQNPALDANTAIQQAYLKAKSRGDFKEIQEKGLLRSTKRTQFVGGGRSPETALSIPGDRSQLVKGRYYTGTGGQIGRWTGDGFELAGGAGGSAGDEESGDDDTLDDGSEE